MTSGDAARSGPPAGLPRSTLVVAAVAIVFVGLATFFLLKWTGSRDAATALRTEIQEVSDQEAGLREELEPLATQYDRLKGRTDVLWVGKLSVCNTSSETITISRLASVYLAEDGTYATFNSEEIGRNLWRLGPGEVRELSYPAAGWDGSVTYYSLWVNDVTPYAGPWPLKAGHCIRHTGS